MQQWPPPSEPFVQSAPAPLPPPPRRRRIWPWVLGGGLLLIGVGAVPLAYTTPTAPPVSASPPTAAPAPSPAVASEGEAESALSTVVYGITTDATTATVNYATSLGSQEQAVGATMPFSRTVHVPRGDGDFLSMVAQSGPGGSIITCSITVDGAQVSKHTSTGPYAVVTCLSGS